MDGKLLVQNVILDSPASTILVYDLYNDINVKKTEMATKIREFGRGYPDFGAPLNVTSFEVTQTDHKNVRILHLVNSTDFYYYVVINASDYSMVQDSEGAQSWEYINLR